MDIELIALCIGALITGISKFSVGGMGMLIAPVLLYAFPATTVLGVLLPMYLITDLMVVACYRNKISWGVILKIIPAQLVGMLIAGALIASVSLDFLPKVIAFIILFMVVFGFWLDKNEATFMKNGVVIIGAGLMAGLVALTANAGGPFISLILMEQKLPRETYISTRAWTFMFIDMMKIPILFSLGCLNQETLELSLQAIPALLVGSFLGFTLLKKIDMKSLKWIIRIISLAAAIKLIIG